MDSAVGFRRWLVLLVVLTLGVNGWVVAAGTGDGHRSGSVGSDALLVSRPAAARVTAIPPVAPTPAPEGAGSGEATAVGCAPDGLPAHTGSQDGERCVATALGEVPALERIPRVQILQPADGATLTAGEPFVVEAAVADLATGSFADPETGYFRTPQRLDAAGLVQGHAHVAIQQLTQDGQDPPAATELAFFEGLEEPAEGGRLRVTVPGLSAPGTYRVQVNTASASHQPVVAPVARHLAPVDVIRVQVVTTEDGEAAQQSAPEPAQEVSQGPGDGIPPAPDPTTENSSDTAGGSGGGPAAGVGGAGDGQPPPPTTTTSPSPDSEGSPEQDASQGSSGDSSLVAAEGGWVNGWVIGGGLLIFGGLALLAVFGRPRRRGSGRRPGRHLEEEWDRDGGDVEPKLDAEPAEPGAAGLSEALRRLQPPEADPPTADSDPSARTDPPAGPERES